ncbi:MAG: ROK family protein [Candidatus Omnitrophica bacterium]|nr:ROK family protein [Candidatus Omnitrophota bacterium]
MSEWVIGVDFGGTNIKVGLVTRTGRVLVTEVLPARAHATPARFVDGVGGAVDRLLRARAIRRAAVRGAVVGAPGPVDHARGVVHSMVNVPGWREVPLGRLMRRRLGCHSLVENDVNLAALGEWRFGAGRGVDQLACLTLGTGVGGGLIVNGALARGVSGAAGEVGHMVINPDGPRCGCGARGCLEAFIGTAGILRMARRAGFSQRALTPEQLSEAARPHTNQVGVGARRDNRASRQVWQEFGRWLGIGVANVVNVLNPERVVIGGGVANAWPFFAPALRRTVRRLALPPAARAVTIVQAQLGNHAGIVGAAVLVWDK